MRAARLLLLVAVVTVIPVLTAVAGGEEPTLEAAPASADHRLVEKLVSESRVNSSPPRPSPTLYFKDLVGSVIAWIGGIVSISPGMIELLAEVITWMALLLFGTAIGVLIVLVLRMRRRHSRRSRQPANGDLAELSMHAVSSLWDDPETCWQELQRALDQGQIADALAALWWWLARAVAGCAADATWTTRQLLAFQGSRLTAQPELVKLCRRLDRMIYGPRQVGVDEVHQLAGELRSAVQ
jgi:hypothetical protein